MNTNFLDDIRQHLIDSGIVAAKECKKNVYDENDNYTCIWVYGGYKEVIGTAPSIQISTASKNAATASERIQNIYAALISEKPNRISTINGKKMKIVETQQPFFVEKDAQQRFVWAFNITLTTF